MHAIRAQSASKTIQKPICVANCVANEDGLRGRGRERKTKKETKSDVAIGMSKKDSEN